MGAYLNKDMEVEKDEQEKQEELTSGSSGLFHFHDLFDVEDPANGLLFMDCALLPPEIVSLILSYVDCSDILNASMVCKRWCNIIKSYPLWAMKYKRIFPTKKPKQHPWFIYYAYFTSPFFDRNLIKNGNGEKQFQDWKIILNYGDQFIVEDPPLGCDPLPDGVPEFNGKTSCFATSYYECNKLQGIVINSNLMRFILDQYKPRIYASEWVAGRFDCGCVYDLHLILFGAVGSGESQANCTGSGHRFSNNRRERRFFHRSQEHQDIDLEEAEKRACLFKDSKRVTIESFGANSWSKVEAVAENYPEGVRKIVFQHQGRDTQFWKGHYGSKMAGGVLKIIFDSIDEVIVDEDQQE